MNRRLLISALVATGCFMSLPVQSHGAGTCLGTSGCERKICELTQDVEQAKARSNPHEILKKQQALMHIEMLCNLPNFEYGDELEQIASSYEDELKTALDGYLKVLHDPSIDKARLKQEKKYYDYQISNATKHYEAKLAEVHTKYLK